MVVKMPKVMTTFELPEEHHEFMDSYNGFRWKLIVSELDEWLRMKIKHGQREEFQEVRDHLYELVSNEGLHIWD
jgi:hypothetical protein